MSDTKPCYNCDGTGSEELFGEYPGPQFTTCSVCGGSGKIELTAYEKRVLDEDKKHDAAMAESQRTENAVEQALRSIKHVFGPYDDSAQWPEAWERDDKPFANVSMYADFGDPSVGIGGWSGLCLTADQSNTVLGEILEARSNPLVEQALLVLCPYADPEDDPDTGRGQAALTLRKALGL